MRRYLIVLVAMACVRPSKMSSLMQSWVGQPATELIIKWGPPAVQTRLDDSTSLLTWETRHDGEVCKQNFVVGSDGVVRRWSVVNCPPFVRR